MVDLEGFLVAVHGELAGPHDAAGVVRQDVDPRVLLLQLRGQGAHLGKVGEVADKEVGADFVRDRLGLLRGTPDDDHAFPLPGEGPRGGRADAVAGSGDDDSALGH